MTMQVQGEEVATVETLDEMESILDTFHQRSEGSRPVIATIEYPHDCRVDIGLGSTDSIVIIWPQWYSDKSDTYYVSLTDFPKDGTKWFWLHGQADTEFDRKYLIPYEIARNVVREFVETGNRTEIIKWTTEHY